MSANEKLFTEFPPNTYQEWQVQLEKELKGKTIEDLAQRSRSENIYIEPFFNGVEESLKQQSKKVQWLLSYRKDNSWEILAEKQNVENIIDASKFHNRGANATQELAYALAIGNELIAEELEKGKKIDEAASVLNFNLSIGNDFFLEISKLRALRLLWANIIGQYQPTENRSYFTRIVAETSERIYTEIEPYTNLLRATTHAMAAIIGGADALYVGPYNLKEGPNSFSESLATNLHHMLKYEGRLEKVLDAGNGSWYIEKLTELIAQKAWALFQEIEQKGGFSACLNSGWIDVEIAQVNNIRLADIEAGKEIIVGVNKYQQKREAKV